MDFELSEEQKALVALMKEFCLREVDRKALDELADRPIPPNATKEDLMARVPWDLISKAHDVGLRQLAVPTEYGGGGYCQTGGWLTLTLLAEAAGYYGGQIGRLFTIPWNHCVRLVYAPPAVQEVFFTNFMKNRRTMTAASHSEPDHGSDVLLPYDEPGVSGKVTAVRDGDYWVINGDKMFCTGGGVSDYISVTVRTDPDGPISKSQTQFLVDTSLPGWSIARVNDMMGNEITSNVQMRFENVRVHKSMMLTELNGASKNLRSGLAAKSLHFMTSLGDCQYVWEQIRDFAKNRIQGGKPIIQHKNIGPMVAEADLMLRTDRLLQYKFAWDCDQEKPGTLVDPLGFWYINHYHKLACMRLIEVGFEVYGGMAPQKELSFERFVRLHQSILHGGGTGILNLVKAAKVL
ncbi:MAG: acyl-CoA/acyl-ACP dehydrogenase [Deltaproteobacteria bacterium]|nr:acyl-CoA/acyl-ACP dehydrogenase [Deltaproteobacteria bacterium]